MGTVVFFALLDVSTLTGPRRASQRKHTIILNHSIYNQDTSHRKNPRENFFRDDDDECVKVRHRDYTHTPTLLRVELSKILWVFSGGPIFKSSLKVDGGIAMISSKSNFQLQVMFH